MENGQVIAVETKTEHFLRRQSQRKISDFDVMLALRCGRRFYEGQDRVYFLGRKDLPADLDPQTARRVDGTVVVVGEDHTLVTTYRNPRFLRELKRRH